MLGINTQMVTEVWAIVMDSIFPSPQNSDIEILTPDVIVLGGGAFGRQLGHEGGALMNGICALAKGTPKSFLTPFHHGRTQQEDSWL